MSGRNLIELGEEISRLTKSIAHDLQTKGQKIPSILDASLTGPGPLGDAGAALKLAEAARELEALVLGPHQALGLMGLAVSDKKTAKSISCTRTDWLIMMRP